jgi:hypothetical protein
MAEEKLRWQLAALRGFQKGRLDGRRDVDRDEAIRRKQVILAALVDDAEVPSVSTSVVGNNDIDLVALEGGLVSVVVHSDSELAPSGDGPP